MNRRLKFYLIGLAIGLPIYFLFFKNKPAAPAPAVVEKQFPAELKVQFDCKSLGTEDQPQTIVSLTANGKTWPIDTVAQAIVFVEKSDLERHKIPASALASCGGWWAGAGDYFYAVREGDSLKVYQGWQAEEQTEDSFHYEVVRTLGAKDF